MSHQASEQMIGYLYQVRYALYLLLTNKDEQASISLEKFDDIAFIEDEKPSVMIQLKHHTKSLGDLTNASTDIWRTLKVWIDSVKDKPNLISTTNFIIITTATAPIGSAAYYLKYEKNIRDIETAYDLLEKVTEESLNKKHEPYYTAFNSISQLKIKQLLEKVVVVDQSSNIIEVENDIRDSIRYSCLPQYLDQVFDRVEGWWFKKSIEALSSLEPVFISQNQLRSYIVSVSQEYAPDNLPIDISEYNELDLDDLEIYDSLFYKQLKLICLGNNRLQLAIRDYYRAFQQRANWVRNDLLYVNELEKYERRLIDEWEHSFSAMEDDLEELGNEITEEVKVKSGKKLYKIMEDKDVRIRERCSEAFVMRGSYHMLADKLKIGWHLDFYDRLESMLRGNDK